MQKVVGSSPIIRSPKALVTGLFCRRNWAVSLRCVPKSVAELTWLQRSHDEHDPTAAL
jgi:hypothetical protein